MNGMRTMKEVIELGELRRCGIKDGKAAAACRN